MLAKSRRQAPSTCLWRAAHGDDRARVGDRSCERATVDAVGGFKVEYSPPRLVRRCRGAPSLALATAPVASPYHIKRHHNAERYATIDRDVMLVAMSIERDACRRAPG